jgi:hypothetical protein
MPVVHLQSDGSLHKVRLVDEIAGPTGPQGPVGEVGVPGVQGHTGITGPAGSQGPAGTTGAQGSTGITGPAGAQGSAGATGVKGTTGITGPAGTQGAAGATGIQGTTGITGPAGAQGPVGDTGSQGEQGITGTQGLQGAQGPVGITGSTGSTGPGGAAGPTGPQGAQGQTGVTGVQGSQGNTGIQGTSGPQGNTGTQGAQGNTGVQGTQGPTGNTGSQGPQGNTGTQGAQGPTGNTGSQGPQGNTGVQGASGPQGNTGIQGTSGPQGATGAAGVTGVKGPTGLIGDSLASHIQLVTGGWLAAGDATNGVFLGEYTGGTYGIIGYGSGATNFLLRASDGKAIAGPVEMGATGIGIQIGLASASSPTAATGYAAYAFLTGPQPIGGIHYRVFDLTNTHTMEVDLYRPEANTELRLSSHTNLATGTSLAKLTAYPAIAPIDDPVEASVECYYPWSATGPPRVHAEGAWFSARKMWSTSIMPTGSTVALGDDGDVVYDGNLIAHRAGSGYTGYAFVPLTAHINPDPWDGNAYSTTPKTAIDLSAIFSLPGKVKAILASTAIRDSGSATNDCYLVLGPTDTANTGLITDCGGQSGDSWERDVLIVPCNPTGDIYYQTATSATGSMDIFVTIWGYWI